jgi:chromosome segregation ATPase
MQAELEKAHEAEKRLSSTNSALQVEVQELQEQLETLSDKKNRTDSEVETQQRHLDQKESELYETRSHMHQRLDGTRGPKAIERKELETSGGEDRAQETIPDANNRLGEG